MAESIILNIRVVLHVGRNTMKTDFPKGLTLMRETIISKKATINMEMTAYKKHDNKVFCNLHWELLLLNRNEILCTKGVRK